MDYEKPPIGASPYWYVQQRRIKDLSEAITRYAEYKLFDEQYAKLIKQWANEIILCCDNYIKIREIEREYRTEEVQSLAKAKADGRLVKRGKWIYEHEWKCSSCGWAQSHDFNTIPNDILKYCPNCGAKMSKEEAEEALGDGE
mgnify:CR=1 FL=1